MDQGLRGWLGKRWQGQAQDFPLGAVVTALTVGWGNQPLALINGMQDDK